MHAGTESGRAIQPTRSGINGRISLLSITPHTFVAVLIACLDTSALVSCMACVKTGVICVSSSPTCSYARSARRPMILSAPTLACHLAVLDMMTPYSTSRSSAAASGGNKGTIDAMALSAACFAFSFLSAYVSSNGAIAGISHGSAPRGNGAFFPATLDAIAPSPMAARSRSSACFLLLSLSSKASRIRSDMSVRTPCVLICSVNTSACLCASSMLPLSHSGCRAAHISTMLPVAPKVG